jgi:fructose-1,6-bisphosphatase/inositol monophosphatase family enzyme
VPGARAAFERVGGGHVLNHRPYDLAAAVLCAEEGGVTVTDAAGRPLAGRPLLGSGVAYQMSIVAAGAPALHVELLSAVEGGIANLRRPEPAPVE